MILYVHITEVLDEEESCGRNVDCSVGACVNNVCKKLDLGEDCDDPKQCDTGRCWDWICAYDD